MKRILFFLLFIAGIANAQTNFVHKPVDAAQNLALPAHTYSGGVITASANGAIGLIDSVTMALGSRILIWRDSAIYMNGIYIVTQLGSGGTPFKLTRDPLANIPNNLAAGASVYVRGGYWFIGKTFTQTTTGAITIGSTSLLFVPAYTSQNNNLTQLNTVTYATHGTVTGAHFRHATAGGNALYTGSNPSLQMINSSFTVAGYVWHDSITSLPQVYINKDDNTTQAGSEFFLGYYPGSSKILMQVETGTNNTRVIGSSSGIPSTGAWHFVVGWFDRDLGRVYIQVDNGTIDSTTADPTIHVTNTCFALGAIGGPNGRYPDSCCGTMNGTLSSWGIWKRTLSSVERTQLYNSGVPLSSFHALPYAMQNESRQTFVSYWALNETSGTRHDRDQAGMAALNAGAINVLTNPMVDQTVPVNITGTAPPATASSNNELIKTTYTTVTNTQNHFAILNQIQAGATDAVATAAIYNINSVAGQGVQANGSTFGGAGNYGSLNLASSTTIGYNVGSLFSAASGNQNYGFISNVTTAKNSATNSGGLIRVQNSGTTPVVNGLYINLSTSANTTATSALQIDNGSVTTAPLILFQQNGTKLGEFGNNGTFNLGNFTPSVYMFHGEISNTDGGASTNVIPGFLLKNTSTANPGGTAYNYAPMTVQANNGGVSGGQTASYGVAATAPYSDSSGYYVGTGTFHKIKFFTAGVVRGGISPAGNFTMGTTTDNANGKLQVTGDITLEAAGNALRITEGSNGRVGSTTLVSGTKAITITGLTTSSRAFTQITAQGGTSTGVYMYKAVCTTDTLTITAIDWTGATVTTDTSVLNYFVIN